MSIITVVQRKATQSSIHPLQLQNISEVPVLYISQIQEFLEKKYINIFAHEPKYLPTHLVDLDFLHLAVLAHALNIYIVIRVVDRFVVPTPVLGRKDVSDGEQQAHAAQVADANDDPRDMVSIDATHVISYHAFFRAVYFECKAAAYLGLYFCCHMNGLAALPIQ